MHRITAATHQIADGEGWSAVTIRRLAKGIEYGQPALYSHFENRDAIVAALAVKGFVELTSRLNEVRSKARSDRPALRDVAAAYLNFAGEQGAIYEAMFSVPSSLRFSDPETSRS